MKAGYIVMLAAFAAASSPALAHPGHEATNSFAAGWIHPFVGLDHLLVALAVGIWAVRISRHSVWRVPLSFCAAMAGGAALAYAGIALPAGEPLIALSVLVLGLLVVSDLRMPSLWGSAIVGLFALFHGMAHAVEQAAGFTPAIYLAGVVTATLMLHVAGGASAVFARERVCAAGVPIAAYGLWLLSRAWA